MSTLRGLVAQGWQLQSKGQFAQAEKIYQRVLSQQPNNADALLRLASLYRQTKRAAEARTLLEPVARSGAANISVMGEYALALVDTGELEGAEKIFQSLITAQPKSVVSYLSLAQVYMMTRRYADAASTLEDASALSPNHADVHRLLGSAHLNNGAPNKAIAALEVTLRSQPNAPMVNLLYGKALHLAGHVDEAEPVLRRVLQKTPNHADAIEAMISLLFAKGAHDEAESLIESKIRAGVTPPSIRLGAAQLERRKQNFQAACDQLTQALRDPGLQPNMKRTVLFELGGIYEKLGEYDRAFDAFRQANDALNMRYSASYFDQWFEEMRTVFTRERINELTSKSSEAEFATLVLGMPRSGTTLVEQILGSHPLVHAGGERAHLMQLATGLPKTLDTDSRFPACVASMTSADINDVASQYLDELRTLDPDAARITDKMPTNFLLIGLIAAAMPSANLIHCMRHPADTCFSIYTTNLSAAHPYSTDLRALAHYYRHYRRLMDHWREVIGTPLYDVSYEAMIADSESQSRDLISFIGLEWDDACLQFHERRGTVTTASVHQVRQPIYTSSVARYRHYEKHLAPMLDELSEFLD